MRKIYRVTFHINSDTLVDIEAVDVVAASNLAISFLQGKGYRYDLGSIQEVKLICEPIQLTVEAGGTPT